MATMGWLLLTAGAGAFPTWMGVYGSYTRHDGKNPGTFTVLMNQDYSGLRAEVGIKIGAGSWRMYPMARVGKVDINSIWQFTPSSAFPLDTPIEFFFYGYDQAGGRMWDNRGGLNYPLIFAGPKPLQWAGNVSHWPPSGQIKPTDDLWVNVESWPVGAAVATEVFYTTNAWRTAHSVPMNKAGQKGNNDWWNANLRAFYGGSSIEYFFKVTDAFGSVFWINNNAVNFKASVNRGVSVQWTGKQSQWPLAGDVDATDDFWVNVESWPTGSVRHARITYSANGGVWYEEPMARAGLKGNNDWWNINLQTFPPGNTIFYRTEVIDQNGTTLSASPVMSSTRVNGAASDNDRDGLPDDWEIFWWQNTASAGAGNPDLDGTSWIPLINQLEWLLGTEPIHSNTTESIGLLWNPAHPFQRTTVHLSYNPWPDSGITTSVALVESQPDNTAWTSRPISRSATTGRFETNLTISSGATNLVVRFSSAGVTNANRGVFWHIPVRPLTTHPEHDTDADGMPDAWEQILVDANPHDGITTFHGIRPEDDFDGDGIFNLEEYQGFSDAALSSSQPTNVVRVSIATGQDAATVIQRAIDQAMPGSILLLATGTYDLAFTIDTKGKAISLRGAGTAEQTVLRATGQQRVLQFVSAETRRTTLDNVTLMRGASDQEGGAVLCRGSSPTFRNVIIRNSYAQEAGGAIAVRKSSPRFARMTFTENESYRGGGALFVASSTGVVVESCSFIGNRARGLAAAGGAMMLISSRVDIASSYFAHNHADLSAGVLFADAATATMHRATMIENRSGKGGGGCVSATNALVILDSSLAASNSHPVLAGATIRASYSLCDTPLAGVSNLVGTPLLARSSYRLLENAPGRNRGNPALVIVDRDGESVDRFPDIGCDEWVDANTNQLPDAWEWSPGHNAPRHVLSDADEDRLPALSEYLAGTNPGRPDSDEDGIPDGWEIEEGLDPINPSDAMSEADAAGVPALYRYHRERTPSATTADFIAYPDRGFTLQQLINTAPDLSIIRLAKGRYAGPGQSDLVVTGKNVMLVSLANPGEAIIDAQGSGRGITFGPGVDERTVLRGITIKNANAAYTRGPGGGIVCSNASPTIEYCTIVSNRANLGAGGLYLVDSLATIRNSFVQDNIAEYNAGGGLSIVHGRVRLEACRITGNRAMQTGRDLGGGGVYVVGGEAGLFNCVLADNRSENNGAGLLVGYPAVADVIHCTITRNHPQGVYMSGDARVINSIIWSNGYDLVRGIPTVVRPPIYSIIGGMSDPARGVSGADPKLHPRTLDLTAASPAVDAGTTVAFPYRDHEDEARWDHPGRTNTVSAVDLGHDEWVDADTDTLPDSWELRFYTNITACEMDEDTDSDGLTAYEEYWIGTNPAALDSDGDLLPDGMEVQAGLNPTAWFTGTSTINDAQRDSDGDGFYNLFEVDVGSSFADGEETPGNIEGGSWRILGDGSAEWRVMP